MDISLSLTPQEQAKVSQQVDAFNKTLNEGKGPKANAALDKNDFLKILITQLSHQDPTQPMDDKAFVAQMAQFSSLEQMTNMSEGLAKVADLVSRSQAVSLLGSAVDDFQRRDDCFGDRGCSHRRGFPPGPGERPVLRLRPGAEGQERLEGVTNHDAIALGRRLRPAEPPDAHGRAGQQHLERQHQRVQEGAGSPSRTCSPRRSRVRRSRPTRWAASTRSRSVSA